MNDLNAGVQTLVDGAQFSERTIAGLLVMVSTKEQAYYGRTTPAYGVASAERTSGVHKGCWEMVSTKEQAYYAGVRRNPFFVKFNGERPLNGALNGANGALNGVD